MLDRGKFEGREEKKIPEPYPGGRGASLADLSCPKRRSVEPRPEHLGPVRMASARPDGVGDARFLPPASGVASASDRIPQSGLSLGF